MKKFVKNIKVLSVLCLMIGIVGCDNDDDALSQVHAEFTHTINQDIGLVTFINTSENTDGYSYLWDFGDEATSTEVNPSHIYVSGTYKVVLTVTNSAGATATYEDTIVIAIPEAITFPFNFDNPLVVYEATTFNGASFEVVENPDPSGLNSSTSNVGAITNSGVAWEGLSFDLGAPLDLTTEQSITILVWSNTPVDVLAKLESGTAADTETTASHTGSGWELLTFTFDSNGEYNKFTIFIDGPGTTTGTFYIDDIKQVPTVDLTPPVITLIGDNPLTVFQNTTYTDPGFTATDNIDGDITGSVVVGGDVVDAATVGTYTVTYDVSDAAGNAAVQETRTVEVIIPPTAPMTSAPIPPARDAADVISLYGESYSTIAIGNYDPNWGQSGFMQVNTGYDPGDGNLALGYINFTYQGTDFQGGGPVNASAMEFLHIDIWVPFGTDRMVKVSPINNGTGVGEFLVEVPLTPGSWNSVDIPISSFTGMTWDSVFQLKFDGQFNGDGSANTTPYDIYLDNIYFHKAPAASGTWTTADIIDFEPAGFGAAWTWNVFENDTNPPLEFVANPSATGINTSPNVAKVTALTTGQPWAGTEVANGQIGPFIIDATTPKIKLMVYKSVISDVGMKLVNSTSGGNTEIKVANTVTNQWEELTFDFSVYIGQPGGITTDLTQIVVFPDFNTGGRTTDNIVYFDNIQFSN